MQKLKWYCLKWYCIKPQHPAQIIATLLETIGFKINILKIAIVNSNPTNIIAVLDYVDTLIHALLILTQGSALLCLLFWGGRNSTGQ